MKKKVLIVILVLILGVFALWQINRSSLVSQPDKTLAAVANVTTASSCSYFADDNNDCLISKTEMDATTAKYNARTITFAQLTRVTQFYNSCGYKVQAGTEDGFAPIICLSASFSPMNVFPINNGLNPTVSYHVNFRITLKNNSNNDLFFPRDVNSMLKITKTPNSASTTVSSSFPSPATLIGDTSNVYILRAGSSRAFNFEGMIGRNTSYSTSQQTLTISGIRYGKLISSPRQSILSLKGLTKTISFPTPTLNPGPLQIFNIDVDTAAETLKNVDANGNTYAYPQVKYSFTLMNKGSDDLFVSKALGVFLGTTTIATNASSTIGTWGPMTAMPGDTASVYRIPAGYPRIFIVYGTVKKRNNLTSSEQLKINRINYGWTTSMTNPPASSITAGLEGLSFIGSVVTTH